MSNKSWCSQRLYFEVILDQSQRTVLHDKCRIPFIVRLHDYTINISKSSCVINYCDYFGGFWRTIDVNSELLLWHFSRLSKSWLLAYLSSPVHEWSFTLQLHFGIFLHTVRIESDKCFRYVLGQVDCTVHKCVATPAHDVLNTISLINLTHKAINKLFSQNFKVYISCWLSFPCIDSLVSIVNFLVWLVRHDAMCSLPIVPV